MSQQSAMLSSRRGTPALVLLATVALLAPCAAQATPFVIRMVQQGNNIVATGSGAIDTTGFTAEFQAGGDSLAPNLGQVGIGSGSFEWFRLPTMTGPSNFGSGAQILPPFVPSSGDAFAFIANISWIALPTGYLSGNSISGTSTFVNYTFASVGITPGIYTWTWGAGPDQSFTLDIGVPEPSALGVFGLGLVLFSGFVALRRRGSLAA